MSRPPAGSIVLVDHRAAVVVEDDELFPSDYPNTIVVPLTRDEGLAHQAFAERIDPGAENRADTPSWALAHHVTSVSLKHVKTTRARITAGQLESLRRRIALALGFTP